MSKQRNIDPALAAAQIVLITLVCSSAVPVFLSDVLHYEAIPHVEAKVEQEAEPEKPSKPIELRRGETPELLQHIFAEAERYGADPEKMRRTIACETANTWDADIQSGYHYPTGGQEQSFGLAQIHLPDWPTITIDQAKDPHFAISFMAEQFGSGNARAWSCYRKLFGKASAQI